MTKHSVTQGTFTLERTFPNCTPARAFSAFSTPEGKQRWFGGPPEEWKNVERAFDFRVGGREREVGKFKTGTVSAFDALYYDIVDDERIIYAYEMHLDGKKISVSLATITFEADGTNCKLTMHEDGAFLDGYDDNASRKHGTEFLLDALASALAR
ncbi:MAG: SRPBCC family protein [Kofleriaceae bacterium]